jgi:hypothetical protein
MLFICERYKNTTQKLLYYTSFSLNFISIIEIWIYDDKIILLPLVYICYNSNMPFNHVLHVDASFD